MSIDVERDVDLSIKLTNLYLKGIDTLVNVVSEVLQYLDKDPMAKMLNKYMKHGGELEFSICRPAYANDLEKMFRKEGITYLRSNDMANGGVTLFVYADRDREKVNDIINQLRSEHTKSGIADRSVFWAYANDDVRTVSNLSSPEAMLFAEHAEKAGILVSIQQPQKGIYELQYAAKDEKFMDAIKISTALELSGISGQALIRQLNYENQNYSFLSEKLNEEISEPFYVVDLDGNEIYAEENGIRYEGKKGEITVDRMEDDYAQRVNDLLIEMRNPVFIRESDKKTLDEASNKKEALIALDKRNGRPTYSKEEFLEAKNVMKNKELYEMKLAMEHPDKNKIMFSIENDEMRLGTFEEFNDLNEETDNLVKEELLGEARRKIRAYKMHDHAEEATLPEQEHAEQVLDGLDISRQREDDVWDLMHDKNNNYIPDEYERGNE